MKRIIALVRPLLRDDVIAALHQVEDFPGASMSEIKSVRRGIRQRNQEHREPLAIDFLNYVRFEIICCDTSVPLLVETIRANAYTGKPGDGKIFVSPIESALRISEGATDEEAL
jgi:nitrogen regulatory protein PII